MLLSIYRQWQIPKDANKLFELEEIESKQFVINRINVQTPCEVTESKLLTKMWSVMVGKFQKSVS